ncbi:hypothetical protein EMIT036CA2_50282 [Chryseobacterium sp. IT-36CA2]
MYKNSTKFSISYLNQNRNIYFFIQTAHFNRILFTSQIRVEILLFD